MKLECQDRKDRIRTVITQDAEVDDQNSLRHFLLYTNEVELQGIIQTSSVFHWKGMPGAATPSDAGEQGSGFQHEGSAYDAPYRWPGTEWMTKTVEDYAQVYPNLKRQDPRYPSPEELRAVIRTGNIGYPGEMKAPSEGSELIRHLALDDDPRTLYVQVWGGTNTLARALLDIETEYSDSPDWPQRRAALSRKIVITACGEQDNTYRSYIAMKWPDIQFVHCLQLGSYAYAWSRMPEGESKERLRAPFMKRMTQGKGALLDGYALWADGKYYEGEEPGSQFGANPELCRNFWGTPRGLGPYEPDDFISEGDSPTYTGLLEWGLRTRESFSYGGFAGRYLRDPDERNADGVSLNYWKPQTDAYVDAYGHTVQTEAMWRYVADLQNDFAARADWCAAAEGDAAEHAPRLTVAGGVNRTASPGEEIWIAAQAANPDGREVTVHMRIYEEASSAAGAVLTQEAPSAAGAVPAQELSSAGRTVPAQELSSAGGTVPAQELSSAGGTTSAQEAFSVARIVSAQEAPSAHLFTTVHIPETAGKGDTVHVIVQAKNVGGHELTHYQQVIITVI